MTKNLKKIIAREWLIFLFSTLGWYVLIAAVRFKNTGIWDTPFALLLESTTGWRNKAGNFTYPFSWDIFIGNLSLVFFPYLAYLGIRILILFIKSIIWAIKTLREK